MVGPTIEELLRPETYYPVTSKGRPETYCPVTSRDSLTAIPG